MTPALHKIGRDEDEHTRYAHFADFNAWLDGEEGLAARIDYGVDALPQPGKALFAGGCTSYDEAFQACRKACRHEALGQSGFQEQLGDEFSRYPTSGSDERQRLPVVGVMPGSGFDCIFDAGESNR